MRSAPNYRTISCLKKNRTKQKQNPKIQPPEDYTTQTENPNVYYELQLILYQHWFMSSEKCITWRQDVTNRGNIGQGRDVGNVGAQASYQELRQVSNLKKCWRCCGLLGKYLYILKIFKITKILKLDSNQKLSYDTYNSKRKFPGNSRGIHMSKKRFNH